LKCIKSRHVKEIFCSVRSPGRRVVEFVVRLRNVPGAITKVSKALADLNVNILSGFHTAPPEEETGSWSFFADLSESGIEPEELAEKLKELKEVLDVNFSKRDFNGIFIDDMHFPMTVMGERCAVFRVETIGKMFGSLMEKFGSGAAFILYIMGVGAGEAKIDSVTKRYGIGGVKALQAVLAERMAKGWGIPRLAEFNQEKLEALIEVEDLFECLPYMGRKIGPQSLFFKGYLEGAFKRLFNKEFEVKEVECIAKGDEKCKFVVSVRRT